MARFKWSILTALLGIVFLSSDDGITHYEKIELESVKLQESIERKDIYEMLNSLNKILSLMPKKSLYTPGYKKNTQSIVSGEMHQWTGSLSSFKLNPAFQVATSTAHLLYKPEEIELGSIGYIAGPIDWDENSGPMTHPRKIAPRVEGIARVFTIGSGSYDTSAAVQNDENCARVLNSMSLIAETHKELREGDTIVLSSELYCPREILKYFKDLYKTEVGVIKHEGKDISYVISKTSIQERFVFSPALRVVNEGESSHPTNSPARMVDEKTRHNHHQENLIFDYRGFLSHTGIGELTNGAKLVKEWLRKNMLQDFDSREYIEKAETLTRLINEVFDLNMPVEKILRILDRVALVTVLNITFYLHWSLPISFVVYVYYNETIGIFMALLGFLSLVSNVLRRRLSTSFQYTTGEALAIIGSVQYIMYLTTDIVTGGSASMMMGSLMILYGALKKIPDERMYKYDRSLVRFASYSLMAAVLLHVSRFVSIEQVYKVLYCASYLHNDESTHICWEQFLEEQRRILSGEEYTNDSIGMGPILSALSFGCLTSLFALINYCRQLAPFDKSNGHVAAINGCKRQADINDPFSQSALVISMASLETLWISEVLTGAASISCCFDLTFGIINVFCSRIGSFIGYRLYNNTMKSQFEIMRELAGYGKDELYTTMRWLGLVKTLESLYTLILYMTFFFASSSLVGLFAGSLAAFIAVASLKANPEFLDKFILASIVIGGFGTANYTLITIYMLVAYSCS